WLSSPYTALFRSIEHEQAASGALGERRLRDQLGRKVVGEVAAVHGRRILARSAPTGRNRRMVGERPVLWGDHRARKGARRGTWNARCRVKWRPAHMKLAASDHAWMAELVDAPDLKSGGVIRTYLDSQWGQTCIGSPPTPGAIASPARL